MEVVSGCYGCCEEMLLAQRYGEFSLLLSKAETNRKSAHIWRIRDRKNPEAGVERIIQTAGEQ